MQEWYLGWENQFRGVGSMHHTPQNYFYYYYYFHLWQAEATQLMVR